MSSGHSGYRPADPTAGMEKQRDKMGREEEGGRVRCFMSRAEINTRHLREAKNDTSNSSGAPATHPVSGF